MMSLPSTPTHISSSWSWPSPRRPRLDEEQGSFAELSDENDTIAIAIPLATEIEQQDAPQMQGEAPQNSWNNSMPLNERSSINGMFATRYAIVALIARFVSFIIEPGSDIMSYAVPIILGVALLLIGLHLFGVF